MHILFISYHYPPEVNAPSFRISEHAKTWAKNGHRVTIVTVAPNHPQGRLYPGFRNAWTSRTNEDGVDVIRIWSYISESKGFFSRLTGFLSFPLSIALHWSEIPRADVVVSTSPQFFAGLSGLMFKRRKRPWVLEIRDLYPASIVAVGAMKRGPIIMILEQIEKFAYKMADGIVPVTDSFAKHIINLRGRGPIHPVKNGVDAELLHVLPPFTEAERLRNELGIGDRFVVSYMGTHGLAQGLDVVLEAATLLRHQKNILFLMVGDGAEFARLKTARDNQNLQNVIMLGQRPKSEMPPLWALTNASLVVLKRHDAFQSVLPSKIFEAMAMRIPIILGVEGEARELLDTAGAGISVQPENAEQLASAVERLASNPVEAREMGAAGRRFVEANFDRSKLAESYLTFLEGLVAKKTVA